MATYWQLALLVALFPVLFLLSLAATPYLIRRGSTQWGWWTTRIAEAIIKKIKQTQAAGRYVPLSVYELLTRIKANISIELLIVDQQGRFLVSPRPKGDVYDGQWHFLGISLTPFDIQGGSGPNFQRAFARIERDELSGTRIERRVFLEQGAFDAPPRGSYLFIAFACQLERFELPANIAECGGFYLSLDEIEKLNLVQGHREKLLPLCPKALAAFSV